MPITRETFSALVLEDTDVSWELHDGKLREKPALTAAHNRVIWNLVRQIAPQLPEQQFEGRMDTTHLAFSGGYEYIPDFVILPIDYVDSALEETSIESYDGPVALVVETWSPSTGTYDVNAKIPNYQRRGDLEIWRVHPRERTLTRWCRRPDGTYEESTHSAGTIRLAAIPEVTIDLDALFGHRQPRR